VGDHDDTLKGEGEVLELIKGGKSEDPELHDSCVDTLKELDDVRESIVAGRLNSMILFAITTDGNLTRLLLSKNRHELIGLAADIRAMIKHDVLYQPESD